jgi:phosphomannomutase
MRDSPDPSGSAQNRRSTRLASDIAGRRDEKETVSAAKRPIYGVSAAEAELADKGRVVLRASGTEPVIRVMVEGEDEEQVVRLAEKLADIVAEAAA